MYLLGYLPTLGCLSSPLETWIGGFEIGNKHNNVVIAYLYRLPSSSISPSSSPSSSSSSSPSPSSSSSTRSPPELPPGQSGSLKVALRQVQLSCNYSGDFLTRPSSSSILSSQSPVIAIYRAAAILRIQTCSRAIQSRAIWDLMSSSKARWL